MVAVSYATAAPSEEAAGGVDLRDDHAGAAARIARELEHDRHGRIGRRRLRDHRRVSLLQRVDETRFRRGRGRAFRASTRPCEPAGVSTRQHRRDASARDRSARRVRRSGRLDAGPHEHQRNVRVVAVWRAVRRPASRAHPVRIQHDLEIARSRQVIAAQRCGVRSYPGTPLPTATARACRRARHAAPIARRRRRPAALPPGPASSRRSAR